MTSFTSHFRMALLILLSISRADAMIRVGASTITRSGVVPKLKTARSRGSFVPNTNAPLTRSAAATQQIVTNPCDHQPYVCAPSLQSSRNFFSSTVTLDHINARLEGTGDPLDVVRWAEGQGEVAMMSSFGTQAAVLLHLATQIRPDIPVVAIDTGFLLPETYQYMETLREHLGLNLHVVTPNMSAARIEATHGKLWESSKKEDHALYGHLTKTEPMERGIASLPVKPQLMLSGVRKGQTETR